MTNRLLAGRFIFGPPGNVCLHFIWQQNKLRFFFYLMTQ